MKRGPIIGIAAVVVVGGLIATWAWMGQRGAPSIQADPAAFDTDLKDRPAEEETPVAFDALKAPEDREAYVRKLAAAPAAEWNDPVLRRAVISDGSERVQLAALEESMRLARSKGGSAPSEAVRMGLASNSGNTRAAALKAARENADPSMVEELIELVDQRDPYANMALNALAYTNDPRAHAKILEIVEDPNADRTLRERAIALIGITKDREAIGALIDLRNGSDAGLARVAGAVLDELNK